MSFDIRLVLYCLELHLPLKLPDVHPCSAKFQFSGLQTLPRKALKAASLPTACLSSDASAYL